MGQRYFQGTDATIGAGATGEFQVKAPSWAKRLIKIEYNSVSVGRLTVKSQTSNRDIITNADFAKGTDNTYFLPDYNAPLNEIFNCSIKNTSGGSIVYNLIFVYEE